VKLEFIASLGDENNGNARKEEVMGLAGSLE
jgi:hypothetical protein